MHLFNLLLMIAVAAVAYYMGFQQGRASVTGSASEPQDSPLPGPHADHLPGPSAAPGRPRGAPPPAAAGDTGSSTPAGDRPAGPPRRSTPPPPAAAGLLDKGHAAPGSDDKADR
jgi:hypothetical protein